METAEIQASRADQLGRSGTGCRASSASCEPTLAQLEATADRADPVAAPAARRGARPRPFLAAELDFSKRRAARARPGRRARSAREALRESKEEVDELARAVGGRAAPRQAAAPVPPDDRRPQAVDGRRPERRGSARRPPPTRRPSRTGQGYTGMEALLNYVYWQTLGINAFDQVGHVLRIVLLSATRARATRNGPTELIRTSAIRRRAVPAGRHRAPDPTTAARNASSSSAAKINAAARGGRRQDRRGARGRRPEAEPKPGQRDLSKPQIVLPPKIRDLLDGLPEAPGPDPRLPDLPGSQTGLPEHAPRLPARAMSRRPATSIVASPVLVGAVTLLVAIVAVLLAVQGQPGPPVRPHLQRQGGAARRLNLVNGNEVRWAATRSGSSRRSRRGRRDGATIARRVDEARQGGRAARNRHAREGAAALGARPEVHRAHLGAHARPTPPATRSRSTTRSSRSSSTSSSARSTRRRATTSERRSRGTARRSRAAAWRSTRSSTTSSRS